MLTILLGGIFSFFAAFGIIEFIRYVCIQWGGGDTACHLIVPVYNQVDKVEGRVRNALLATTTAVIAVDFGSTDGTWDVLTKLQSKHPALTVLTYDEYLNFLHSEDG